MLSVYRYRFGPRGNSQYARTFTESQWLHDAEPYFIRLPTDTDVTFTLFLIDVFHQHLARSTIVPDDEESDDPRIAPPLTAVGCPYCHHIHQTNRHGYIHPFPGHRANYNPYVGWEFPTSDWLVANTEEIHDIWNWMQTVRYKV